MISAYIIIKKESVRVPNKNFKYLGSRPLYLWCIETLLQVGEIDEVLINTDAKELLDQIPQNSKIRIIERPLYLCGNHFVANDLLRYDLEKFKNQNILMTHVTCPFVSQAPIEKQSQAINNQSVIVL